MGVLRGASMRDFCLIGASGRSFDVCLIVVLFFSSGAYLAWDKVEIMPPSGGRVWGGEGSSKLLYG